MLWLDSKGTYLNCYLDWNKASTPRILLSVVDVLGVPDLCSSRISVLSFSNSVHQSHTCFYDITLAPYTPSTCRWISAGNRFFRHKNIIKLLTSMAGHVSINDSNWDFGTLLYNYLHLPASFKFCDHLTYIDRKFNAGKFVPSCIRLQGLLPYLLSHFVFSISKQCLFIDFWKYKSGKA